MFEAVDDRYLVPFDGSFKIRKTRTEPKDSPGKKELKKRLEEVVEEIAELQRVLYASDKHAVLLVFQAMDAAGKDSTIRAVLTGVNPAGCQVYSFKQPSKEEFDHDFLWRTSRRNPERGRIGIFNRSYYEEVLVVRVHPEFLENQRLPSMPDLDSLWASRFKSIRDHERHLARSGTVVVKFFLNVSKEEQKNRFLARIDRSDKNWKFQDKDVEERQYWDDYQDCYEAALRETSRSWAPWYAIPADSKPYMRLKVAEIVRDTLKSLKLKYPVLDDDAQADLQRWRDALENE